MFCPNCGTNLPDNAEFCSNCGTNLNNYKTIPNLNENKKINNHKIKDFIIKYKKIICICIIVFIILFIGVFSFNKLYDYTKIDWDKNYGDINVTRNKFSKFTIDYTAWVNEYNYTFTYGEDKNGNPKEVSLEIEQPIIE